MNTNLDLLQKAKVAAPIGTIKQMGDRFYIRTAEGWKYHSKDGGSYGPKIQKQPTQDVAKQVAEGERIQPSSQEEGKAIDINKRFAAFSRYTKAVIQGSAKSMIAYGTGGVGKTYTVTRQFEVSGMKAFDEDVHMPANSVASESGDDDEYHEEDSEEGEKSVDYDYVKITGKVTTPQLYKALYEHNGKIILFDDCDSVLLDSNSVNLFKGALDSSGDGTISYGTTSGVKDDNGEKIPKRFKFKGRAIFISNLPSDSVPQPIKSRSLRVDLTMSPEQTIERLRMIAQDPTTKKYTNLKFPGVKKYTHDDLVSIIDYLDEHKNQTSDLNVRTVGSLLAIKQMADADGVDWKEDADHMIFSKSESPSLSGMYQGSDIIKAKINQISSVYKSKYVVPKIEKSCDVTSTHYIEKGNQEETLNINNMDNNHILENQARIRQNIIKSFNTDTTDLEKGGEGSRGGKVIGHTASGKAIYQKSDAAPKGHYDSFTSQDHFDAAKVHSEAGNHKNAHSHQKVGEQEARGEKMTVGSHVTVRGTGGVNTEHKGKKGKVVGRDGTTAEVEVEHEDGRKEVIASHYDHFKQK